MKNTNWIKQFKPGVKNTTHLITAAIFWTVIGLLLLSRGLWYLFIYDQPFFIIAGIILGLLKSTVVLDKTAVKNIDRIVNMYDGTCLGAIFSAKTWLVVVLMSFAGVIIRHSDLSRIFVGTVCVTIGFSLCYSSRFAWKRWYLEKQVKK